MESLNESKGTTVSELELALYLAKKALKKVVDDKPNSGVIVAKGKPNEARMKYSEAIEIMDKVKDYFALKGCMSYGICGTCTRWNNKGHTPNHFGTCGGNTTHEFDTCPQHSRKGGGFGL